MLVVNESAAGLVVSLHVAPLTAAGTLPIPPSAWPVVLEVGASDRNTMREEFLGRLPAASRAFLVTAEPLIEKYARGLAKYQRGSGDGFQPLAQHADSGLILPLAIGPTEGMHSFTVAANAGCSSLLAASKYLPRWCATSRETRMVPVVRLERLLRWMDHPVEFAKIDSQARAHARTAPGGAIAQHQAFPHRRTLRLARRT